MAYAKIQPFMPSAVRRTCHAFAPWNSYTRYSRVFRQRRPASRRAVWNERHTSYMMYKGEFLREARIDSVVVEGDTLIFSPFCVMMLTVL